MHFGTDRRPSRHPRQQREQREQRQSSSTSRFALYLRQGRVPSFVRDDDPPALADELAALRRRQAMF